MPTFPISKLFLALGRTMSRTDPIPISNSSSSNLQGTIQAVKPYIYPLNLFNCLSKAAAPQCLLMTAKSMYISFQQTEKQSYSALCTHDLHLHHRQKATTQENLGACFCLSVSLVDLICHLQAQRNNSLFAESVYLPVIQDVVWCLNRQQSD